MQARRGAARFRLVAGRRRLEWRLIGRKARNSEIATRSRFAIVDMDLVEPLPVRLEYLGHPPSWRISKGADRNETTALELLAQRRLLLRATIERTPLRAGQGERKSNRSGAGE